MARTYRKSLSDIVLNEKKLKSLDIRHGSAVVADGAGIHTLVADVFSLRGTQIRYDSRWCDDRCYEIPNAKRKIKDHTHRAFRRIGKHSLKLEMKQAV